MEPDMKFSPEIDSLFQILNRNVCEYVEPGTSFTIEETAETGKAEITILTECPCFVVRCLDEKGNIRSLPFFNQTWKQVTQCADHLLFLFDREAKTWSLHIFELKRSPDSKKWEHILRQFNGAVIRSYAIAGALRILDFAHVHLHCCYRRDMGGIAKLRQLPGKSSNFMREEIKLSSYPKLTSKNVPIQLDDNGYAEIRLDKRGCTMIPRRT